MSRYTVLHQDKGLAFGRDHSCGEFLIIWQRPNDPKERTLQDSFGPNPSEILVDLDTRFNVEFDRTLMECIIQKHGFDIGELEEVYKEGIY